MDLLTTLTACFLHASCRLLAGFLQASCRLLSSFFCSHRQLRFVSGTLRARTVTISPAAAPAMVRIDERAGACPRAQSQDSGDPFTTTHLVPAAKGARGVDGLQNVGGM